MEGTCCQNFWKHKGQIRDIPMGNFRENKGHGLGGKNNVSYRAYWVYFPDLNEAQNPT